MNAAQKTILLRGWIDFLDGLLALFGGITKQLTADDLNVSFLRVDDSLHKQTIEKAMSEFAVSGTWPMLTARQLQLLSIRAHMAREVLLLILRRPAEQRKIRPPLPSLADKERMIDWLFIRSWNAAGDQALEAWIAGFLHGSA